MALRSDANKVVKSRQVGSVTFSAGVDSTKDATISAVNTAKLEINFPFQMPLDAVTSGQWYYWTLINSTTIRCTRVDITYGVDAYYEAIEYL